MEQNKIDLCDQCASLNLQRSDFVRPPFDPEGRYCSVVLADTLQNLLSKQAHCCLCRLFLHALKRNEQDIPDFVAKVDPATKWEVLWMQSSQEYDPFGAVSEDMYGSALFPRLMAPGSHNNYSVQLVDDRGSTEFLRGRMISDNIDTQMVQGWLDRCQQEHGPECASAALEIPSEPHTVQQQFLVIDVEQECLVELPTGARYAALSYVWGLSNWPRTLKSNVETFKQRGELTTSRLPLTISDSIKFLRALELRYLWVDSLCIIQDHDMKQNLIENMDTVYGHAYLCIMAASGEAADSGLSGWSDEADRSSVLVTELVKPDMRLGVLPFFDVELMSSPHAQRAWTFQEGLLSPRCLVFLNSLIFFCCRAAVWREDINAEVGDLVKPFEGANTLGRTLSPWPLRRLQQHITAYNHRKLSFQSDALNAFAGIQKVLARAMDNTKFWYGMPASVFDWALVWSAARGERLKRRQGFPTWSWAGWEGHINMAVDHYSEFDQEWLLYRTWIEWFVIDQSGNRVLLWEPIRDGTARSDLIIRRNEDGRVEVPTPEANFFAENDEKYVEEDSLAEENDIDARDIDDIQQLEPCPQYGWPTDGNPYGRLIRRPMSHPFPIEQEPPSTPQTTSLQSGTLCFNTVSAKYKIERCTTGPVLDTMNRGRTVQAGYFNLTDNRERICGIIWDQENLNTGEEILPAEVEIILLSWAAPGTKDPFNALKLEFPPIYQDSSDNESDTDKQRILDQWHAWDMFNIMLIVPTAGQQQNHTSLVSKNRGIGLLHKRALEYALPTGPYWKEIYLC